ncbi:DUF2752 domain-containing protein [Nocardioides terrisoli]|uniref:DUF2752 domain-containing protein n=1 Tax=Nocardioides terrisoli TaxID=3388267 RepID=UPI00287B8C0E|nr:DUF2752 domain-containing protein [Nocardioides marmorisolisilvae]
MTDGPARRARLSTTVAVVLLLLVVALHLRDPHRHLWVLCPFKALTGWDCPACGGLRAVNDLGNGRLVAAAHSNLLFVASLPLAAVAWLAWLRGAGRDRVPAGLRRLALTAYVVVALAFTVFRNTPWGSALHVS